jgi:hypothetical protein
MSAPAVTCATLLGAYTPVLLEVKQQQQQVQEDLKQEGQQLQGFGAKEHNSGRSTYYSQKSPDYSRTAHTGKLSSGAAGDDAAAGGPGNRKRRLTDDGQLQQVRRQSSLIGAASPITEDVAPADEASAHQVLLTQVQDEEDAVAGVGDGNGGGADYVGSLHEQQEDIEDQESPFEDDGEGLYDELQEPVNGEQDEQHDVDDEKDEEEEEQQQQQQHPEQEEEEEEEEEEEVLSLSGSEDGYQYDGEVGGWVGGWFP